VPKASPYDSTPMRTASLFSVFTKKLKRLKMKGRKKHLEMLDLSSTYT